MSNSNFALIRLGLVVIFLLGFVYFSQMKSTDHLLVSNSALLDSCHPTKSFELASRESFNFFNDTSEYTWKMLKQKAQNMQPNTLGDPEKSLNPLAFFQENYEPEFVCLHERRIGKLGDGGKWVCDPHRISSKIPFDCLVYSVGSSGDASFEAAVVKEISPHCEIHVFDFGNHAQSVAEQTGHSQNVYYHQWGISDVTQGQYKTLDYTVKELGHENRTIDIFKIDCEGCELVTFRSWLESIRLQQILVEIHPEMSDFNRLKQPETVKMFQALHDFGYAITHKEPNIQFSGGACVEYNFFLLSKDFWK